MKYVIFLLLRYSLMQTATAQITGSLVNAAGQPVVSAGILILNGTDSTVVKMVLSDGSGNFFVEDIPGGTFLLHITAMGYQDWISPVFALTDQQKRKFFEKLVLATATKDLQGVTVTAHKQLYQQREEGLVVNVENSLLTKGSSALQVLERSPGVLINQRDNSIELNGKAGVMVMLNGKLIRMAELQLLDLLAGMSADDIARIELLTSPSAKYDAEGSAGLINIVLKQNRNRGTNGSASLTAGYGYKQKATANFNLARNTARLNLYGSYTYTYNHTYSNMYVDSWQNMAFLGGSIHALGWDTTHMIHNNHNATVGADIKLNARTTIGSSIIYSGNRSSRITNTHLGYNILPDSVLQYDGTTTGNYRWNNVVSSLFIEKLSGKEGKININLDYIYFNNNGLYQVAGNFINKHGEAAGNDHILSAPAQHGYAGTRIKVLTGKTDYTNQLGKQLKLEAGIKATWTQSSSLSGFESLVNGVWTSAPQATNNIVMKESISAAYAMLNMQPGKALTITAGVRYEYALTAMRDAKTGEAIITRRLGALFPSVFFTRTINAQAALQLSYTKRITRPSYNDLASYAGYSDPTAVYTGNPFLKPSITQTIKLGYNYKNYSLSLLYSRDENAIARYQLSESPEQDMLFISPQNISWQQHFTVQANIPFKINNWWTMQYNFAGGLRHYKVTYTKQPFEQSYFGYSFSYSQLFKLPHRFSLELSGNNNGKNYNGTQKVAGFGRVNMGIKKELSNNKGSFQLSVTDIFRRERYDIHYGTLTNEAFDIRNHVIVYTETSRFPIIRLTYTRSFGNAKAKTNANTGAADEQERIRKE